MSHRTTCILISLILSIQLLSAQTDSILPLIPYPVHLAPESGTFILNAKTQMRVDDGRRFVKETAQFRKMVKELTGVVLTRENKFSKSNFIAIRYDAAVKEMEGYTLKITADSIVLKAKTTAGIFYGTETIKQLLFSNKHDKQTRLPALYIEDAPAYPWRGLMLDVARHFFSIDYLKKTIDRLAYYKGNKLHLHLTDDQGWRIEIKKYPLLTQKGGWRTFNNQDSSCQEKASDNPDFEIDKRFIKTKNGKTVYGGYYTQKQIKDLVKYASDRHVEIIPEIDMPGHFNAAIRAYPFLTGNSGTGWGQNFSIPLNPCNEKVYTFTQNVLSEIFSLFPGRFIHIGADEVEQTSWTNSPDCNILMSRENLSTTASLQSYFVHRMQQFAEAHGKKIITWDDALEGGVDSNITIMYWRSWVKHAPGEALRNGNPLIMSPNEPLYFDYQPDKNSVYNVYHAPIVPEASAGDKGLLQGGQANLWTEMIPSEQRADYMVYPRFLSLAERLWSNTPGLYATFPHRLAKQYGVLNTMGVHFRLPDLEGFTEESVFVDSAYFNINLPGSGEGMQLRYTLDSSLPTMHSPLLRQGLTIKKEAVIRVAAFTNEGKRGMYTGFITGSKHLPNQKRYYQIRC